MEDEGEEVKEMFKKGINKVRGVVVMGELR
jgi:hypothetical protein